MAVAWFEVEQRFPFADGRPFGDTGAYEQIIGKLTYSVAPGAEVNRLIADLDLAPRDGQGCVSFSGDISLVVPVDRTRGNGSLIVDVPNRGRPLLGRFLNGAGAISMEQPFHPGDGFIFNEGFSMATVGWQFDVPSMPEAYFLEPPILGGVRGSLLARIIPDRPTETMPLTQLGSIPYSPAAQDAPGDRLLLHDEQGDGWTEIERSEWQLLSPDDAQGTPAAVVARLKGGFEPGREYSVVYEAKDPPLAGAGLLALREAASFLRSGACVEVPTGFDHVLAVGVSQTGRLLRHMLSLGLNLDETGAKAYDGLFVAIAGGARGQFNHRFAQPSAASTARVGAGFPFADAKTSDPYGDKSAGLFDAASDNGSMPKVVAANTSWEYWRGDASLAHTAADGAKDLEMGGDVRSYMFAGTHHIGGTLPQLRQMPLATFTARYGFNVVDHRPAMRAAFMNLARWVSEGVEPPPSRVPRIDDGTAVTRRSVLSRFAAGLGLDTLDPEQLETMRSADLGPDADDGIGAYPPKLGPAYTGLVPRIDEDFNDDAGVRLPDVTVPVGTHTGWNPRDAATGSAGLAAPFAGFSRFFAATPGDRAGSDPRPSISERYAGKHEYLNLVRADAKALARERYILAADIDWVVENCAERYDVALATGTEQAD